MKIINSLTVEKFQKFRNSLLQLIFINSVIVEAPFLEMIGLVHLFLQ